VLQRQQELKQDRCIPKPVLRPPGIDQQSRIREYPPLSWTGVPFRSPDYGHQAQRHSLSLSLQRSVTICSWQEATSASLMCARLVRVMRTGGMMGVDGMSPRSAATCRHTRGVFEAHLPALQTLIRREWASPVKTSPRWRGGREKVQSAGCPKDRIGGIHVTRTRAHRVGAVWSARQSTQRTVQRTVVSSRCASRPTLHRRAG
jgi:hypothetical protein